MIVLINLNKYIGGGETLFVRFAKYLILKGEDLSIICKEGSYISKELDCYSHQINLIKLTGNIDYYYLRDIKRLSLLDTLSDRLRSCSNIRFVTFCLRDLYLIVDLSKRYKDSTISHLILHELDYLYVAQSLYDKLILLFFKRRNFSQKKAILFNSLLLNIVNNNNGLISMMKIINDLWLSCIGVRIPDEYIVPLPVCQISKEPPPVRQTTNNKIIWIGRLVNFKIPSLLAMVDFISTNPNYTLTIVGDGDMNIVENYIQQRNIEKGRINLMGELDPAQLESVIKQHDIGYAMGTSIIEIAQWHKPVIIALSAPSFNQFSRTICGGLFSNSSLGDIGAQLNIKSEMDINTTIEDAIKLIEDDYVEAAKLCYNKVVSDFSLETNLDRYYKCIMNTKSMDYKEFKIPKPSLIRRWVFCALNKL